MPCDYEHGFDYGYGDLGNRLIWLFHGGPPDFAAAEELLRQGADLNAEGDDQEENLLSEILEGYVYSAYGESCPPSGPEGSELGRSMCAIIRFFLDHGFDVTRKDGCYGAQCLYSLVLSTFDRYLLDGTKLLLDAGARNRTRTPGSDDPLDTPLDLIDSECSFQNSCEGDHAVGNIYEAAWQIYQAVEDGRPYGGIDWYGAAVGKRILKVLAEGDRPVFYPMALPEFRRNNCFTADLYFIYDGGVLRTNQYADFWTDTVLPDRRLTDVSRHFKGIVGGRIARFNFDHRTIQKGTIRYGQPIVTIETDSGWAVRFSINFGEVQQRDRAAYFELLGGPEPKGPPALWQRLAAHFHKKG